MALLTAGLLVTAVLAALYAAKRVRLAREHGEEARRVHREASRPYVVVTIEPGLTGPQLFEILVRNIGQRPAWDRMAVRQRHRKWAALAFPATVSCAG
jgi:hypothetical protein